MGSNALSKIHVADDLAGGQIDDNEIAAVRAGHADTRIPIDGDIGFAAVRRDCDFVAGNTTLRNLRQLPSGDWVDDAESVIPLVGDEDKPTGASLRTHRSGDAGKAQNRYRKQAKRILSRHGLTRVPENVGKRNRSRAIILS